MNRLIDKKTKLIKNPNLTPKQLNKILYENENRIENLEKIEKELKQQASLFKPKKIGSKVLFKDDNEIRNGKIIFVENWDIIIGFTYVVEYKSINKDSKLQIILNEKELLTKKSK